MLDKSPLYNKCLIFDLHRWERSHNTVARVPLLGQLAQTPALRRRKTRLVAFSHTPRHTNTISKTHTHISSDPILCCVGRWKVNLLIQPHQPFRKLYGANRKRVNPQPRALSPCLTSLQCTKEREPLPRRFKVQTQGPTIIDAVKRHRFNGRKFARKSKGNIRRVGSRIEIDHKYSGK